MGNILENEWDLILKEFNAHYKEKNSSEVTLYLSITPEIHYKIQINFENYPEKPEFILTLDLYD